MARRMAKRSKQKSTLDRIFTVLILIFIVVFLVAAGMLINYYIRSNIERKNMDEIVTQMRASEELSVKEGNKFDKDGILMKYSALHKKNEDLRGWIKIDGTRIDYPVMQRDVEFYLHKNFEKEYADRGLPFLDVRSDTEWVSSNLIIHGHNMRDGTMFADLLKYKDNDYAEKHKIIKLDTLTEEREYELIGVFDVDTKIDDWRSDFTLYDIINMSDEEDAVKVNELIEKSSSYKSDLTVSAGDDLLTLSTCSTYDAIHGRYIILAKRVDNAGGADKE